MKASIKPSDIWNSKNSSTILQVSILNRDLFTQYGGLIQNSSIAVQQSFFCNETGLDQRTLHTFYLTTDGGDDDKESDIKLEIKKSSLIYTYVVKCPYDNVSQEKQATKVAITLDGDIEYVNPYGYLMGEQVGMLFFYAFLFSAYVIIGIVWSVKSVQGRRYFARIHAAISVVLVLCVLESLFDMSTLVYFNKHGKRSGFLVFCAIVCELGRKVLSRLMILLICLGFGSIKKQLTKKAWMAIGAYAVVYLIFTMLNDIARISSVESGTATYWSSLSSVPVSLLDAAFYAWIFYALTVTLVELSKKNQIEKIQFFKRIMYLLVFYVATSVMVFISEGLYSFFDLYGRLWSSSWFYDAAFQIIFCLVLCGIMRLFLPSHQSFLFLNTMQLSSDDFEDVYNDLGDEDTDDGPRNDIILGDEEDMDLDFGSYDEPSSQPANVSTTSRGEHELLDQETSTTTGASDQNNETAKEDIIVL